jgi:hypothetical protein
MRVEDAVPDEVDVRSKRSRESSRSPSISQGPVPLTIVEKIDPDSPSHGEVPGTAAHEIRKADAVPDMVLKAPEPGSRSPSPTRSRSNSTPGDLPIPKTKVTKVAGDPSHGEVPGTLAYQKRLEDAEPDAIEQVQGKPLEESLTFFEPLTDSGLPTASVNRSLNPPADSESKPDDGYGDDEGEDDFGDDFDEFEEGAVGDDDFGDFDEGFREPDERTNEIHSTRPSQAVPITPFVSSQINSILSTKTGNSS